MAGNIANIQPQRERWKRSPPTMATRETSLRSLHWFPTDGITHKLCILSQQRVFPAKISFKTQKKVSPKPEGEDRERADSRSPREYVTIWKEIEFTRILIRFKEEEIAKTEDEMACAEELLMKSKRLVGNKAQYLTKSHADLDRNSCATLQLQRAIDTECRIQKKQMDAELRNLRNGIMNSIGILNDIRTMQALLHEVSPSSWIKAQGCPKLPLITEDVASLNAEMLERLKCSESLQLYFKDPRDLIEILARLEQDNLTALQHASSLENSTEAMIHSVNVFSKEIDEEIMKLRQDVSCAKASVQQEEENLRQLLWAAYRCSQEGPLGIQEQEDFWNMTTVVGKAYELITGADTYNLSILQMMSAIEMKYNSLLKDVSTLPSEVVNSIEKGAEIAIIENMKIEKKVKKNQSKRLIKRKYRKYMSRCSSLLKASHSMRAVRKKITALSGKPLFL